LCNPQFLVFFHILTVLFQPLLPPFAFTVTVVDVVVAAAAAAAAAAVTAAAATTALGRLLLRLRLDVRKGSPLALEGFRATGRYGRVVPPIGGGTVVKFPT